MEPASHHATASLNQLAFSATVHCLTGCAIGEVLGMVISTAFGWSNAANIVLSIALLLAGAVAFPVNRWVVERGKGHPVIHGLH